jgi:hypothetical protein
MKLRQSVALTLALAGITAFSGCAHDDPASERLSLDRVVLYRSGVGYFERTGDVDADVLRIRCRKDQVNDILKSLTIVDRSSGQAVSVSMPLDPQSWASAALSTLSPGSGDLASVLGSLRGTDVTLKTPQATVSGRILMVELLETLKGENVEVDHRISVLDGGEVQIVKLSEVESVAFQDQELAMQLNRSLDASLGEGMFQQVEVEIRLAGAATHDLLVSYVVSAPVWKPTYRVVLPAKEGDKALLQGWAVIDNTSGEDWPQVKLALTSGSPIAFKYDLHSPRNISRPDMSSAGNTKVARVALGETTVMPAPAPEAVAAAPPSGFGGLGLNGTGRGGGGASGPSAAPVRAKEKSRAAYDKKSGRAEEPMEEMFDDDESEDAYMVPSQDDAQGLLMDGLASSTRAAVQARQVSGLTQFDLKERVSVPEGSSTMVAILNTPVQAEQVFLYRPGGGGGGYENNPYRVVRFDNTTPFILEPGPIAIYDGGNFVGEGISETIAAKTSATIPFAVEPSVTVIADTAFDADTTRLLKVSKGVLYTESFQRRKTTWKIKGPSQAKAWRVLIRHTRYGAGYDLKDRPEGTEELPDAWLVPVKVEANATDASITLIEQTPTRRNITMWDAEAVTILQTFLEASDLDAAARERIQPIVQARRDIYDIDVRIQNLKAQQRELDQRANETRQNLLAIQKDPAAGNLRARLNAKLEEFTKEGDKLGRTVVELTSQRLEKKIELDERLESFTFEAPAKPDKK